MNLHRTRHRPVPRPPRVPGSPVGGWTGRNELADLRDDLRQDPELAGAFAGFDAGARPVWARPVSWWIGSVLVIAALVMTVWWAGLVVLGLLPLVVVPGALVLLAAGKSDRRGPA
jgi:hypothetical protein